MLCCHDRHARDTTDSLAYSTYLTSSIAALSLLNRTRFWNTSLGVLDSMKVGSYAFRVHYNSALLPDTLTEPYALKRWDAYTTTYALYSRDYPTGLDSVFARRFAYDSLGRIVTDQKVNGYSNGWIWGLKNYAYTGTGALRWYQIAHTQNRSCDPNYGCTFAGTTVDTTYGYQYDAVNNLTQEADSTPCCVTNGTFSTGNRLTGWGSTSYTYDTDGNRATKGGGTTYTWSATGKLMKVANGSSTVEFAYNALGQLARRKTNGTIDRYYVWDGGQLLYVLDGAGNRLSDFSYLPSGEPLALSRGSTGASVSFFTTDGQGNVIGLTDGSAVQQRLSYAPWGATSQSGFSLDTTALAWKGNLWEGGLAGLYYVQNRWYDPASRGFISGDPIGLAGGVNTYAYAGNDPINGWDPSGLRQASSCWWLMNSHYTDGSNNYYYFEEGLCPGATDPSEIWPSSSGSPDPVGPASGYSGVPDHGGGAGVRTLPTVVVRSTVDRAACHAARAELALAVFSTGMFVSGSGLVVDLVEVSGQVADAGISTLVGESGRVITGELSAATTGVSNATPELLGEAGTYGSLSGMKGETPTMTGFFKSLIPGYNIKVAFDGVKEACGGNTLKELLWTN